MLENASDVRLSFFSLLGIRGDVDFMIFADSASLDANQAFMAGLLATKVGRYLEAPLVSCRRVDPARMSSLPG